MQTLNPDNLPPDARVPGKGRYPVLHVLLPLAAGIGCAEPAYRLWGDRTAICLAAAGMAALGCIGYLYRFKLRARRAFLLFLLHAGLLFVGAALLFSARRATAPPLSPYVLTGRAIATSSPKETPRTWTVNACLSDGAERGRTVRFVLQKNGTDTTAGLAHRPPAIGDALFFATKVQPLRNRGNPGEFDYATYLRRTGVCASAYCGAGRWTASDGPEAASLRKALPWKKRIAVAALRLRQKLLHRYAAHFEGETLAALSAMTLGDKSRLDPATRQVFSETGTAHLLALSGLHIGILFGLIRLLLRPFRNTRARRAATAATIALLWGFTLLAGCPLSLVRAAAMLSIVQVADTMHRQGPPAHSLFLAAAGILLVSPEALFDTGFQLSFTAVFFILWLSPKIPRWELADRHGFTRFLYDGLVVSACAQIGTLPLTAYYFHVLPLYSLPANLVVIPLIGPLLACALFFFLLPASWQAFPATCMEYVFTWMADTLRHIASWPSATVSVHPSAADIWIFYTTAFALFAVRRRSRRAIYLLAGIAIVAAGSTTAYRHRPGHLPPRLIFYNNGQCTALHCIVSEQRSYLWTPRPDSIGDGMEHIRRTFWEAEGLDPVVLREPCRHREVALRAGLLSFGGKRIALPGQERTCRLPARPVRVDYLLICRHSRGTLDRWLRRYTPGTVVLDASLSESRREQLEREAEQRGHGVHDLARDGALIVPLWQASAKGSADFPAASSAHRHPE